MGIRSQTGAFPRSDCRHPCLLLGAVLAILASMLIVTNAPPAGADGAEFVTTWDTRESGATNDNQIKLPLTATGQYDFVAQWGDGTSNQITSWDDADAVHTYPTPGRYTVTITGTLIGWRFADSGDKYKILNVTSWGSMRLGNDGGYFEGASNLVSVPGGPDLTGTTNAFRMFYNAQRLQTIGSGWNVSGVTNMKEMFAWTFVFDQDIGSWNTGNVTDMSQMFEGALRFNQNIGGWQVQNVTDTSGMFHDAPRFNQDIGGWQVLSVTNMSQMFDGARAFNGPIGGWNVSNVTNMGSMFYGATAFDQDLGGWNISKVTNLQDMFNSARLSTPHYDALLIGWAAREVLSGRSFNAGSSRYSARAAAARQSLVSRGWSIADGGQVARWFAADPDPVAFGNVRLGESPTRNVTITNTGSGSLDFPAGAATLTGTDPGQFAIGDDTCSSRTVASGSQCTVELTFAPSARGSKTAKLHLAEASGAPLPEVSVSGSGVAPQVTTTPAAVAFGAVRVGTTSAPVTVTVTNTGNDDLSVNRLSVAGVPAFELGDETCVGTPIAPGAACTVELRFTPTSDGGQLAVLRIEANAPGSPHEVELTGEGAAPSFSADPDTVAFDTVPVGNDRRDSVVVWNHGAWTLSIEDMQVVGDDSGEFTVGPPCAPIPPRGVCVVAVTFRPTSRGAKSAALRFVDDAAGSPHEVALTGTGTAPGFAASPQSVDWGSVRVGTLGELTTVSVTNSGNVPLTVAEVGLAGSDHDQFSVTEQTCRQAPIPAGGSCVVRMRFSPASEGAKTAVLQFTDDAPGSPHQVPVSGTGTAPRVAVSPGAVEFGKVLVGRSAAPATIRVRNTGTAPLAIASAALGGAGASQFTITEQSCMPAPVAPASSCTVAVRFTPTTAGAKSAVLRFVDDAPGTPHQVALSGTGEQVQPAAPTVTSITPAVGATTGGNNVVMRGRNLLGATVRFGTARATVAGTTATELRVRVPAHSAGRVGVTATTAGGTGAAPGGYTYVTAPTVSGPTRVAGGYVFTLSGLAPGARIRPGAALPGVSSVHVAGGRITVFVRTAFSGRIRQPVTVQEGGAEFRVVLPITVNPGSPSSLSYTPGRRSTVRWAGAVNATGYQVLVNGTLVCTTPARTLTCVIARWLGPKSRVQVRSLGGSNTASTAVTGHYRRPEAPALLASLRFRPTATTLSAAAKRRLRRLASLVDTQGFGSLVTTARIPAGKANLSARKKLAGSRARNVTRFLRNALGGDVRVTVKRVTRPRSHTVTIAVT